MSAKKIQGTAESTSADSSTDDTGPLTFEGSFKSFASYGEKDRSDHKTITLKNIDKWIKQAGISVTPADTAITFSKIARKEKRISITGMGNFLNDLAKQKGVDVEKWKAKMLTVGAPRSSMTPSSVASSAAKVTSRLTDTSAYTGMHKGKFDESGKAVREEEASNDGYVQGYSNKDTYEERKT